jgi:hypothetical protein
MVAGYFFAVAMIPVPMARAEPSTADRAIAEKLFDQGRTQMIAGRYAAACDSFAESMRLDPGTGTRLNLATCHEAMGKLASAWVEFREAVVAIRRENRPDRMRFAQDHLASIEPLLAYLTILVSESLEGQAPAVHLDGAALGPAVWGVPIPIDDGWHEVLAQTPTAAPWRFAIWIRNGERRTVTLPKVLPQGGATGGDPKAIPDEPRPDKRSRVALPAPEGIGHVEEPNRHFHTRRRWGWTLGAVGVVGLTIGTYLGVHAAQLWGQRDDRCPANVCTPEGLRLGERAGLAADGATWAVGAGLLALGASALLLLWPNSQNSTSSPSLSADIDARGRLSLRGSF